MISGGTLIFAMITPSINPNAVATSTARINAIATLKPLSVTNLLISTTTREITEPMESSMPPPPETSTRVIPTESIAMIATCLEMLIMLAPVRNVGVAKEKIATITSKIKRTPYSS